jgi:hypothetical protein
MNLMTLAELRIVSRGTQSTISSGLLVFRRSAESNVNQLASAFFEDEVTAFRATEYQQVHLVQVGLDETTAARIMKL